MIRNQYANANRRKVVRRLVLYIAIYIIRKPHSRIDSYDTSHRTYLGVCDHALQSNSVGRCLQERRIDDVISHLFFQRPAVDDVRSEVVVLRHLESECLAFRFVVVVSDGRRLRTEPGRQRRRCAAASHWAVGQPGD